MNNKELSTISIGEKGFDSLPEDFSEKGKRSQKEIILTALQDHHLFMVKLNDEIRNAEAKKKHLNQLLKQSQEYQEIRDLAGEIKENKQAINLIIAESHGMLKLAKRLGIDVKAGTIKQLKQAE